MLQMMACASRGGALRCPFLWYYWRSLSSSGTSCNTTTTTMTGWERLAAVLGGSVAAVSCSYYYYYYYSSLSTTTNHHSLVPIPREEEQDIGDIMIRRNNRWLNHHLDEDRTNNNHENAKFTTPATRNVGQHNGFSLPGWLLSASSLPTTTQLEGAANNESFFFFREHDHQQQRRREGSTTTSRSSSNNTPTKVYDFVVIGYGTAGRSAVETLQRTGPSSASIALLDPLRRPLLSSTTTTTTSRAHPAEPPVVDYFAARAVGLQPGCRTVELTTDDDDDNNDETVPRYLQYRHAVLIASGARGAAPPSYLMDEASRKHIYELRPTILPTTSVSSRMMDDSENDDDDDDDNDDDHSQQHHQQRPVLSAEQVRTRVRQLAQQPGATIGVVGSGFEAIDVAVEAAAAAAGSQRRNRRSHPVTLIFGSHGPASHALPNYLSTAVSKKLKSQKIAVLDRSLIRYIAADAAAGFTTTSPNAQRNNNNKGSNSTQSSSPVLASSSLAAAAAVNNNNTLNVYTAKSFDFLDGQTTAVDALILCPDTTGPRGTAVVPTPDVPAGLTNTTSNHHRPWCWYQSWSALSVDDEYYYYDEDYCYPNDDDLDNNRATTSTNRNNNTNSMRIGCYRDDGRIAVNPELMACHGVYAAGSVAKYANPWTGNATVASGGCCGSVEAGRTAAHNMILATQPPTPLPLASVSLHKQHNNNSGQQRVNNHNNVWWRGFAFRGEDVNPPEASWQSNRRMRRMTMMRVMDPLPIWRSDVRYSSTTTSGTEPTALSEIGITALCVGNCEAESMATHGVWWSNLSAFQRRRRTIRRRPSFDPATNGTTKTTDNYFDEDDRRQKLRQREIIKSLKPVYGIGVVYYLDRTGRIQGVMTWGMPFTESDDSNELNQTLVEQMKTVIRTNGGLRRRWLPNAGSNSHGMSNNNNNSNIESVEYSMKMAQYLQDTSEQLLRTALESHGDSFSKAHQLLSSNSNDNSFVIKFPRPLHRYTEVRPPSLRSVSVLKRQDGLHGHGVLGEDMFCRWSLARRQEEVDDDPPENDPATTATTVTTTPGKTLLLVGSAVQEKARHDAQYRQWRAWEQVERQWDENEARARPPKEELLWIRKGDETRNIPHRERMANAYKSAMGR